jgi:hypothetical protein
MADDSSVTEIFCVAISRILPAINSIIAYLSYSRAASIRAARRHYMPRWSAVNAPELVALVRAGVKFERG